MLVTLIFKTLDDMDDDKEAKKTVAAAKPDEDLDIENLIRLSESERFIVLPNSGNYYCKYM